MGGVETKRPHGGSTERQSEGKMGKFSGYSNTCFYSNSHDITFTGGLRWDCREWPKLDSRTMELSVVKMAFSKATNRSWLSTFSRTTLKHSGGVTIFYRKPTQISSTTVNFYDCQYLCEQDAAALSQRFLYRALSADRCTERTL